jgi:TonB family protein
MPATEAQIDAPSAGRLVIRIKLIPQEPPQPPVWRRVSKGALLIAGIVAVVLGWLGINTFRKADPVPPPATEPTAQTTVTKPTEAPPPVATEVHKQPDAPPSAIDEVLPDVSRSALDTIRGTVRVSIRVTIDQQGGVVSAKAEDRGPSRYFERLALKASRQWTFTPATSQEQRMMQIRFNFTRSGVTAQAAPLPAGN